MKLIEKLIEAKKNNDIIRLGTMFKTDKNDYFYDTGTGKVVKLDEPSKKIIKMLMYNENRINDLNDLLQVLKLEDLENFEKFITEQHLFQAEEPQELFSIDHCNNLENAVNYECEQIILELTGKCNQRCKYCIYNDAYIYNRSFNNADMTREVAKAAIDYMKEHGKQGVRKAITFYGGEPLMNYDLLKWSIEYARSIFDEDDVSFSFTTNLTLITEEIGAYLGTIPNLHLVASLDGPEDVQNSYRVYADGSDTFKDAIKGLRILCKALKSNKTSTLMINAVYTPPFSYQKICRINDFFDNLDYLPDDCSVQITYPAEGSFVDNTQYDNERDRNSLWAWITDLAKSDVENKCRKKLYTSTMLRSLIKIQKRFLSDKPINMYPFNACCVPGARRLYVSTNGELFICEKIGSSPSIGNILTGVDIDKIRKYYVKEFNDKSIKYCKKCWAIRMCPFCYTNRFDENGIRDSWSGKDCESAKIGVINELALYHSILEDDPNKLEGLNEMITR